MRPHRSVSAGARVLVVAALVGAWVAVANVGPARSAPAGRASGCEASASPGVSTQTIDVAGTPRQYRLAVPSEPTGKRLRPLILNFHGANSNDVQQAAYSQLEEKGLARGFVVIMPNAGSPSYWVAAQPQFGALTDASVAFASALIDHAKAGLCIDTRRIYATGFSNGATMSSVLGCKLSPQFAAIAPVAGVKAAESCPRGKPMSVIAFHGTADPNVPYEGGPIKGAPDIVFPSVETAVRTWAQRAGCRTKPASQAIGTEVQRIAYRGCARGVGVMLYTVTGGGHTWPGGIDYPPNGHTTRDINAADLILDFFAHHPQSKNARPERG